MNEYERTVQAIKDLDCKVSKQEWNKIAMQYNYLSSYSIMHISGISFTKFCINLHKRKKN